MRIAIGIISAVGTLLFGLAFVASFMQPARIEGHAQELLRREVEARTVESLKALERTRIGQFAARLAEQHPEQTEALRRQMRERLVPFVEAVVAEMRDPDCPCRRKLAAMLEPDAGTGLVGVLQSGGAKLTAFVRAKYVDVAAALLREFRIFTGANALMFALLGIVLFVRRGARARLLPAAAVLLAATAVVGGLYLFGQNWLHTVVFGDYVGLYYFLYLAIVGALLADLLVNRGRASARLAASFGGGASAVLC
ncbi:MAG TPA: hypothetical protein VLF18_08230 [Tahibacter sp.]|uniref:hypothetical protein n=1 Tax=Tahibacter sp. TaxID=2056211 RepID=UPI002BF76E26|nr:hypothetical protein [Tahibacter sp.]HSX60170.1 hypothetical protein [Tahibacter sp.]